MQPIGSTPPAADLQQLKTAARDFEALLLGKILESARPKIEGPQAEYRAMADVQLAKTLAMSSPLGVAKMLEAQPK